MLRLAPGMPPTPVILGYSEAAMWLRTDPGETIAGVVSIHGPREFGVGLPDVPRLDLILDDVELPDPADPESLLRTHARERWAREHGLCERPPTREDAAALVAFAHHLRGATGIVLCHCGAGMSRAPAAALILLTTWHGPGSEADCVRVVRSLRPGCTPHSGLVGLADELLGRGGVLAAALRSA
jgi:predicted protein tyrosine phosphatase